MHHIFLIVVGVLFSISLFLIVKNLLKSKKQVSVDYSAFRDNANKMIVEFNRICNANINVLEDKIEDLKKLIELADSKVERLNSLIADAEIVMNRLSKEIQPSAKSEASSSQKEITSDLIYPKVNENFQTSQEVKIDDFQKMKQVCRVVKEYKDKDNELRYYPNFDYVIDEELEELIGFGKTDNLKNNNTLIQKEVKASCNMKKPQKLNRQKTSQQIKKDPFKSLERYGKVYKLASAGRSVGKIAKEVNMSQGEVMLLLGLRQKAN